ncbi:MAG TPA: endonuclease/exonuclease/phosphatase family protein [Candidatus Saccharimonadales bacterium]|nr:endonuclease/exonuclease/phosphatase family protein [Candidatus Saccharimonadales bacterium]
MTSRLRIATFNTLADSYTGYGDYRHAPKGLMQPGARIERLIRLVSALNADVVGLQEVEEPLAEKLSDSGWQTKWSQKEGAPDGCLTLVGNGLAIESFDAVHFSDGSGHVAQLIKVGGIAIANTHIKWDMPNRIAQVKELVAKIPAKLEPHAVLLGDFNDRPGEPARRLVAQADFQNLLPDDMPTAYIANREGPASIDLLAVRGLHAELVAVDLGGDFDIREIPSNRCPSDHIPIVAEVALPQTNG